ncbi:NADH dehydrogenase [ubiquinone] 1 alpha subcomplex assembly factor 3-like [Stegodyphus dumicola]|uniref:NADH dehydrogenase [ubiquinone] 1 alpha subcomplex assembly factor 3-like n=1 Tax=Stegodyphus dumicola TaxID=202533 RepID=UPI0015A96763|nr:NADH dehydrogenase [ubiquinone] 1 alpha subcomplex assembly factor 3-like [Stegodyphus dumicola]XP_035214531.1 NADH dehydrogenase [ubiquinone] 1 alpha subcomplex assembly factor 3-like [Stegodyphus dumicola]XP_035214539.1 NADH dehydrogenase [ubiquinone] 1 alpha subcomplex assembly factor 3-like [Stegodyphus dumicola]XP_035214544.1 NADH dehydrogenase [ubiquinone] 1 alpha subcomplex assembly factor 3-like [Stegodyphus dumicola]
MAYLLRRICQLSQKISRNCVQPPFMQRSLSIGRCHFDNYEGDGKTTVTVLNKEHKHLVMIDSYSNMGFRLNQGIFVMGPVAVFPRSIMQWNVEDATNLKPESLTLFCLLEPKLDLLVIGTGSKRVQPSRDILEYLKANKISTEVLPTDQACSIFNFLNVEGRCVAGAFIPPERVTVYEEELELVYKVEAMDDYQIALDKNKM